MIERAHRAVDIVEIAAFIGGASVVCVALALIVYEWFRPRRKR